MAWPLQTKRWINPQHTILGKLYIFNFSVSFHYGLVTPFGLSNPDNHWFNYWMPTFSPSSAFVINVSQIWIKILFSSKSTFGNDLSNIMSAIFIKCERISIIRCGINTWHTFNSKAQPRKWWALSTVPSEMTVSFPYIISNMSFYNWRNCTEPLFVKFDGYSRVLLRYASMLNTGVGMRLTSLSSVNTCYMYDAIFIWKYPVNKTDHGSHDITILVYFWHPVELI